MTQAGKPPKNWRTRHIDASLGARIVLLREETGVTRKQLAGRLGISLSQMQHFEDGDSRVSAAQLWQICGILGVKVSDIFADLPSHVIRKPDEASGRSVTGVEEEASVWVEPPLARPEVRALSRAAARLKPDQVETFVGILKALKPK